MEATIIDTPEGIELYRIASAIAMLRIEVNTGMKHSRGSVLQACKANWGCPKGTKKGALAWMESYYEKVAGRPYGAA
jgi:hypothetical protein